MLLAVDEISAVSRHHDIIVFQHWQGELNPALPFPGGQSAHLKTGMAKPCQKEIVWIFDGMKWNPFFLPYFFVRWIGFKSGIVKE